MEVMPFRDKISASIIESSLATGIGRSSLYELIAEGRLRTKLIKGRRLVLVSSLLELIEAGESETPEGRRAAATAR